VDDDVKDHEKKHYKRSPSTLKKTWVNYVVVGPFVWSARSLDYEHILESPDRASTVKKTNKFLGRQTDVLEFFGMAKFCQERLISRLDARSRSRFRFIKFPPNIISSDPELSDLDDTQLTISARYRPPKQI
jgi:hypothetical protein